MNDNHIAIAIGVALLFTSPHAKTIGFGMPPHRLKPTYPAHPRLPALLFLFGLVFLAFGFVGLLRQ